MKIPFAKLIRRYYEPSRHKGEIAGSSAISQIASYRDLFGLDANLKMIGHEAGNYEQYPHSWKDIESPDRHISDVRDLMDEAFNGRGLDGIELDFQMYGNEVYITHDPLDGMDEIHAASREYFSKNSLARIIEHFIRRKYHQQNKSIYFEIKCLNDKTLAPNEIKKIKAALAVIENAVEACDIKRCFCFISFTYQALKTISDLTSNHDLFLIAGTNRRIRGKVASFFLNYLNYLNQDYIELLKSDGILAGIWFDPYAVSNFSRLFNGINRARKKKLDMYVSTYMLSKHAFSRSFTVQAEKLENIHGLIFEIGP
ncbi:hypothetical protein ACFL5V_06655 [Fibrobacterota bacterium]